VQPGCFINRPIDSMHWEPPDSDDSADRAERGDMSANVTREGARMRGRGGILPELVSLRIGQQRLPAMPGTGMTGARLRDRT